MLNFLVNMHLLRHQLFAALTWEHYLCVNYHWKGWGMAQGESICLSRARPSSNSSTTKKKIRKKIKKPSKNYHGR
jgi:hypothetical protein